MEQVNRLNIQAAIDVVRSRSGAGIERIPNTYHPGDLRAFMKAIGENMLPGKFVMDSDNSYVYENVRRWVDGDSNFEALDPLTITNGKGDINKGIYIAGPTGTGKTVLLDLMLRYAKGLYLKFKIDGRETSLVWDTYRSDEICMDVVKTGDIDRYVRIPVLCINDVGSEPKESLYMGNRVEVLRMILERRGDNHDRCLTLITSNLRMDGLPYGSRVMSRLYEMCNYYELKGQDRRR